MKYWEGDQCGSYLRQLVRQLVQEINSVAVTEPVNVPEAAEIAPVALRTILSVSKVISLVVLLPTSVTACRSALISAA